MLTRASEAGGLRWRGGLPPLPSSLIGPGHGSQKASSSPEIGPAAQTVTRMIAFALDGLLAAVFVLFGVFARKGRKWAFLIGMTLYSLDTLIFLVFKDFLSLAFHLFALWGLYGGLKARNKLIGFQQADTRLSAT
jgi:hypothetical protein